MSTFRNAKENYRQNFPFFWKTVPLELNEKATFQKNSMPIKLLEAFS